MLTVLAVVGILCLFFIAPVVMVMAFVTARAQREIAADEAEAAAVDADAETRDQDGPPLGD